jgi:hypothetical protein
VALTQRDDAVEAFLHTSVVKNPQQEGKANAHGGGGYAVGRSRLGGMPSAFRTLAIVVPVLGVF